MDRDEHLQWAKDRALEYAKRGDTTNTIASMISDLGKHPHLEPSARTGAELGMMLAMTGHLETVQQLTEWVEGFN